MVRIRSMVLVFFCLPLLLVGCGPYPAKLVRVTNTAYNPHTQTLQVSGHPTSKDATGENVVNINDAESVTHFTSYAAPDKPVKKVIITGTGQTEARHVQMADTPRLLNIGDFVYLRRGPIPGVRMDTRIRPLAGKYASALIKGDAVIREARKKLGTKYIWGHNEDRGQYGFDCSNFTAYVYHHALGYQMSGASQVQYHHVGRPIARRYAQKGDLIIFERGKHVGIYAGGNSVIQCGGGLGKVGYIRIGPRSYWGRHITEFKRMF